MRQDERKNVKNGGKRPNGDATEIGVVRVFSNPGPDAEERLRRLLSLMVRYATREATTPPDRLLQEEGGGEQN